MPPTPPAASICAFELWPDFIYTLFLLMTVNAVIFTITITIVIIIIIITTVLML